MIDNSIIPCISVFTGEDDLAEDFTDDDGDACRLELFVRISAKETEALEDEMDRIAVHAQKAILGSNDFNQQVHDIQLQTTVPVIDDEAERKIGQLTLMFEVIYQTPDDDPETLIT
ncbi:MAG: hypothetical protein GY835_05715 [bacterium]|nr:hypothetical protein [bacterium]